MLLQKEWGIEEKNTCVLLKMQYGKDYEIIQKVLNERHGNDRTIAGIRTRISILTKKKKSKNIELSKDIIKKKEEKEVISNKTSRYFEELKKHKNIDENLINKASIIAEKVDREKQVAYNNYLKDMKDRDDQLLRDLQLMFVKETEKAHKPIRKVAYFAAKDKEENINIIFKKLNDWIEQMGNEFPEAKITLSNCKDVLTRNEKGQFKNI